jgi:hypothetical protein
MKNIDSTIRARRYLVRAGFSQEDTWREALGESAELLVHAACGECLDAPDWIPAGCASNVPSGSIIARE